MLMTCATVVCTAGVWWMGHASISDAKSIDDFFAGTSKSVGSTWWSASEPANNAYVVFDRRLLDPGSAQVRNVTAVLRYALERGFLGRCDKSPVAQELISKGVLDTVAASSERMRRHGAPCVVPWHCARWDAISIATAAVKQWADSCPGTEAPFVGVDQWMRLADVVFPSRGKCDRVLGSSEPVPGRRCVVFVAARHFLSHVFDYAGMNRTLHEIAGKHPIILVTSEKDDYNTPQGQMHRFLGEPDFVAHWCASRRS